MRLAVLEVGHAPGARSLGAALVLFPELLLCGYPPKGFLEIPKLRRRAKQAIWTSPDPADWNPSIAV